MSLYTLACAITTFGPVMRGVTQNFLKMLLCDIFQYPNPWG